MVDGAESSTSAPSSDDAALDELDDLDEVEEAAEEEADVAEPVFLGGDASLEIGQVDEIAAELGVNIVLVAGDQDSGKTSLLVALYDQFLSGEVAGFSFVESRTLDAFDTRQFGSRIHSGRARPEADRTEEREMRFLHLRLVDNAGRHQDLMATDTWGEVFEEMSMGVDVRDNVPIAPRVDRVVLLIDGEAVIAKDRRQTMERKSVMLIGALFEEGGVRSSKPLLIALSKSDVVLGEDLAWYRDMSKRLVAAAERAGVSEVEELSFAAMPLDGQDARGLHEVIRWMGQPVATFQASVPTREVTSERTFLSADRLHDV